MRPLLIVGLVYVAGIAFMTTFVIPTLDPVRRIPRWLHETFLAIIVLGWPVTIPIGLWLKAKDRCR